MNICGEVTNSGPAKMKLNWVVNQLVIKNIHINYLIYQSVGFKSKQMYDEILTFYFQVKNKCTEDDKYFSKNEFSNTLKKYGRMYNSNRESGKKRSECHS